MKQRSGLRAVFGFVWRGTGMLVGRVRPLHEMVIRQGSIVDKKRIGFTAMIDLWAMRTCALSVCLIVFIPMSNHSCRAGIWMGQLVQPSCGDAGCGGVPERVAGFVIETQPSLLCIAGLISVGGHTFPIEDASYSGSVCSFVVRQASGSKKLHLRVWLRADNYMIVGSWREEWDGFGLVGQAYPLFGVRCM